MTFRMLHFTHVFVHHAALSASAMVDCTLKLRECMRFYFAFCVRIYSQMIFHILTMCVSNHTLMYYGMLTISHMPHIKIMVYVCCG